MPIHPDNKHRYPKDWKAISARIKERAEGQCECQGECGLHPGQRCIERHRTPAKFANGIVILTVAHLNHEPEDCSDSNLKAMCQRCHLRYDRDHHAASRVDRRDRLSGQGRLI